MDKATKPVDRKAERSTETARTSSKITKYGHYDKLQG
jgi:hypothetical protein